MPANGSSSSMIDGSAASARAISQRRRSPPDSAIAGAARRRGQAEFVEQLLEPLAARVAVGLDHLEHRQDVLLDGQPAEDRGFLRQIAEAEDRAAVHRQPVMSSPSRKMRPQSGFTSPMTE